MKAIILAAGFGIRLESITMHKPKSMIKVCGKPILEYQLDAYQEAGIDEIIIVTGYKSESIENFVNSKDYKNVTIVRNNDYDKTNNMYSLWMCKDILLNSERTLISNADVVFDRSIIQRLKASEGNFIVCEKGLYNDESMKITINKNGIIDNINKVINEKDAFGCSIDLYSFSKEVTIELYEQMDTILKENKNQWTEIAIQKLCKNQIVDILPFCIEDDERWFEVDTIEDLVFAESTFSPLQNKIRNKKEFIFDLDGTVYIGDSPIDGVDKLILILQKKGCNVRFLSNNSSKDKSEYVQKLKSFGICIEESQIILSTDVSIKYLKQNKFKKGFIIGTKSMKNYLRYNGLLHSEDNPEFVLLGYDTELEYEKICNASKYIYSGLPYFATHNDKFCPTMSGPIPDAGSFIEMFKATTGREPIVFGKPEKFMIDFLSKDAKDINDYVFIGDRLHTDFEMAKLIGLDFICVLTGETKREDIENEAIWPSLILESAAEISNFV